MITVATFTLNGTLDKSRNLANVLSCIDQAAAAGADLVVLPEVCLHGYVFVDTGVDRAEVLGRIYREAEPVPDGPSVRAIAQRAVDHGVHVVYGLNEAGDEAGMVYNTAVLTGPAGHVGSYRKVHLAIPERFVWQRGTQWPVFETPIGRIGMLICYDKVWPEAARELMLGGAELLVMPTAWSNPPMDQPEGATWAEWYDLYERARALENNRWFISSNFAGPLGDAHFFGVSQIIDPRGQIVATSGITDDQEMVLAEIDVRGGIETAYANLLGAQVVRDRQPHTYRRIAAVDGPGGG